MEKRIIIKIDEKNLNYVVQNGEKSFIFNQDGLILGDKDNQLNFLDFIFSVSFDEKVYIEEEIEGKQLEKSDINKMGLIKEWIESFIDCQEAKNNEIKDNSNSNEQIVESSKQN